MGRGKCIFYKNTGFIRLGPHPRIFCEDQSVLLKYSWMCAFPLDHVWLPLSQQPSVPTALQPGAGFCAHFWDWSVLDLHRSCVYYYNCCEFLYAAALLCPEDTVFLLSSTASRSCTLSVPSLQWSQAFRGGDALYARELQFHSSVCDFLNLNPLDIGFLELPQPWTKDWVCKWYFLAVSCSVV